VLGPAENRIVVTPNSKQLLFFVVIGVVTGFLAWYSTRRFRMPPDSEVSRAFDFTETPRYFWQTMERTYRLRNDTFGAAFVALQQGGFPPSGPSGHDVEGPRAPEGY
jgi:hypothetical protein